MTRKRDLYERAYCRDADPEWFTETSATRTARTTIAVYCGRCPVAAECYELIGSHAGFTGIAGGRIWGRKGTQA